MAALTFTFERGNDHAYLDLRNRAHLHELLSRILRVDTTPPYTEVTMQPECD